MAKKWIFLVVVAGLGVSLAIRWRQPEKAFFVQAPVFTLPNQDNQSISLESFKGQLILIHFWASWCPPCLEELPKVLKLAQELKDSHLQIVLVSNDQNWNDARQVLSAQPYPATVVQLLDRQSTVAERFGTYQFPETYLVGPHLEILKKWVGAQDWTSSEMRAFLLHPVDR